MARHLSGGTISVSGITFTVAGSHYFAKRSAFQPPSGTHVVTVEIVGDGQQVSTTTSRLPTTRFLRWCPSRTVGSVFGHGGQARVCIDETARSGELCLAIDTNIL